MKWFLSILCGCLWLAASCPAQESASSPLLLVYVEGPRDDPAPRIALGVEKPTLKISAFEKCVTISQIDSNTDGIAVQLKPEDAKALAAAVDKQSPSSPDAIQTRNLWFATPDMKVLGQVSVLNCRQNLVDQGILSFYPNDHGAAIIRYLNEKLRLK